MGVLIWDDPRTAHITNLACTVMKVQLILNKREALYAGIYARR